MCDTRIVVPCYNEAARLQPAKFRRFSREHPDVGILFVDDGSTDRTRQILEQLVADGPGEFALDVLERNQGKAEAVRRGMQKIFAAGARFAGYWDADLATPLAMIPEFRTVLEERSEIEVVLGSRVKLMGRDVRRSELRHYLGRMFATAASLVLDLPVYDTQCGAKLFRSSEIVREIFVEPFATRWIFDVELLARYLSRRRDESAGAGEVGIYELVLSQWRDVEGSKLGARDFIAAPLELAKIWHRYGRKL